MEVVDSRHYTKLIMWWGRVDTMKPDIVEELRRPEHTGESRCIPCTVVNSVLALLASLAVARKSKVGGWLVAAISAALLYLRGYVVPGTPTLTKRYLPPAVLRWFGKDPGPEVAAGFGDGEQNDPPLEQRRNDASTSADANRAPESERSTTLSSDTTDETIDGVEADGPASGEGDLETFFLRHGVLEPCQDGEDLCLTDEFEAAWVAEARSRADSTITPEAVAHAFGVAPEPHELELLTRGETQVLESETKSLGQWPSRAALAADLAASDLLSSRIPEWRHFDSEERGRILNALRMFLETCPSTGGAVQLNEDAVESCCSSHRVLAVTCEDTGERLFEHHLPASEPRN